MMIPEYLMSVGYLEKQDLRGSYKGMCYRLHVEASDVKGEPGVLKVWCWPQPLCFEAARLESKQEESFSFNAEGIAKAGRWLEERYSAGEWKTSNYLRRF